MDGEFDREIDDGGWGIKGPYKPVGEQLEVMEKAVKAAYGTGKEAEDMMIQMRKDVNQILTDQGEIAKCTDPLLAAFWRQEKRAGQDQEEAQKDVKTGSWLKKGEAKDRRDKASQDRKKWALWALFWQGVRHLMVDNTGHTQPHKPPSYSPPQPTTGLYSVFDVKEGAVEVTGLGRCVPSAPFAGQDQTHRGKIRQPTDEWQLQRLMALTAGPPTPDLFPIPDWIPVPPHTQPQSYAQPPPYRRGPPQWQQNSGRGYGRGGGRPGRGRGGPPRGGTPGACFACGQMGHWSRECPLNGGQSPRGKGLPAKGSIPATAGTTDRSTPSATADG
ncbi:protein tfg-1-like [Perca fluviatilis]|uniref:protein tfg-1-like n=1 Tax=Perca fluviatilis TaxID=8168 RepID=UPI00196467F5|nr:protein tfg-1-like [Perca fluviatilis]